nr:MAG: internal scaffolding protein [Microviridae sp.]
MSKFQIPFFRSPYNYDTASVSQDTGLACLDVTMAVQSAADECDINTIVRRFGLSGQLPSGLNAPQYGDFLGVSDFHSAVNAVMAAEDSFLQLPAEVRSRFQNDPGQFVDFCSDDANRAEAEKLGLVFAKPVAATAPQNAPAGAPPASVDAVKPSV